LGKEISTLSFKQWPRYTHMPFLNKLHEISYTISGCPKITSNISYNVIYPKTEYCLPKYKYTIISQIYNNIPISPLKLEHRDHKCPTCEVRMDIVVDPRPW